MTTRPALRDGTMTEQWWRVGGVLGLAWAVVFIVGLFILQSGSPAPDDSIAEVRTYFTDDGGTYLFGDYVIGIAFLVFFLPFLVILRRVLGTGETWAGLLARVALLAGALAIVWGGLSGVFWGALAVGAAENPEVDDSAVRTLMELNAYAFAGLLMPIGVFMGAAGLSIWLSGVLWRWLGILGLIGFLGSFIGAAWPIDGDEEGALAGVGLVGFAGMVLFVILVSINLLMLRNRPLADNAARR